MDIVELWISKRKVTGAKLPLEPVFVIIFVGENRKEIVVEEKYDCDSGEFRYKPSHLRSYKDLVHEGLMSLFDNKNEMHENLSWFICTDYQADKWEYDIFHDDPFVKKRRPSKEFKICEFNFEKNKESKV